MVIACVNIQRKYRRVCLVRHAFSCFAKMYTNINYVESSSVSYSKLFWTQFLCAVDFYSIKEKSYQRKYEKESIINVQSEANIP